MAASNLRVGRRDFHDFQHEEEEDEDGRFNNADDESSARSRQPTTLGRHSTFIHQRTRSTLSSHIATFIPILSSARSTQQAPLSPERQRLFSTQNSFSNNSLYGGIGGYRSPDRNHAQPRPPHRRSRTGLDDDSEQSLLSRLNSPELTRLQSRSNHRWTAGSLRIVPDWISSHSTSGSPSPTARTRPGKGSRGNETFGRSNTITHINPTIGHLHSNPEHPLQERRSLLFKNRHKLYDPDDQFQVELVRQSGNGIRVWYESYCTIDWLHESIKESIRRKKLAKIPGLVGIISRLWDRSQAWVLVSLIGICTALVASLIVSMEMYFFDLREGELDLKETTLSWDLPPSYCGRNRWMTPKRFCCRSYDSTHHPSPDQSHRSSIPTLLFSIFDRSNLLPWSIDPLNQTSRSSSYLNESSTLLLQSSAFSPRSFINQWSTAPQDLNKNDLSLSCPDWHRWSELWSSSTSVASDWSEGLVYIFWSLILSGLSGVLTVYLSRSTQIQPHHPTQQDIPKSATQSTIRTNASSPRYSNLNLDSDQTSSQPKPSIKVSYFAAGSGIPEIKCILSGFVIRGYLGAWTLITKSIGLGLAVGSGLSLGKEGPFVHIASCIGNLFTRFFPKFDRNEGKRREILSSACAAGVSAAFGAPIGGVLFSLEEVSYFFPPRVMWRSCWCAMVAAATLRALDPYKTGKTVLFEVTYDRPWHFFELIGFISLGILGGVFGALLAKFNAWWSAHFRKLDCISQHPIIEVLMVTFVTCLAAQVLSNRLMKLGGTELVYELLAECDVSAKGSASAVPCISDPKYTSQLLLTMGTSAILKFFLTVVTFGIKCPSGIFIPALSIGALLGRMLGIIVEYGHYLYPNSSAFGHCDPNGTFGQACIVPGVWAMVGATAMLAGVTRTTVSLAVIAGIDIIFVKPVAELTGSLVYILPISMSVLVAKTTADAIERRSIYDLVIEASKLPYLDAKSDYLHYAQPIDIMDSQAAVIELSENLRVSDLQRILDSVVDGGHPEGSGFPILERSDGERRIVGYIGANELQHSLLMIEDAGGEDPICSFQGADPDSELTQVENQIDLGHLVDHAPVTVSIKSPMELLHEMFVRLGVRYLIIQDQYGSYLGIIEKNRWLKYLDWIEKEGYQPKDKEALV